MIESPKDALDHVRRALARAPFVRSYRVTQPIPPFAVRADGMVTRTLSVTVGLMKPVDELAPEEFAALNEGVRLPPSPGFVRVAMHVDVSPDKKTIDYRVEDAQIARGA